LNDWGWVIIISNAQMIKLKRLRKLIYAGDLRSKPAAAALQSNQAAATKLTRLSDHLQNIQDGHRHAATNSDDT
jgi:hypothetical protein